MRKAVALLGVLAVAAMSPPPANAGCAPWCSPVSDLMPRWSADGTKLAYASGRGGVLVNVVIAKPDATSGIPLPDLPSPQQLSPDFSRYAFYTGYGDGTDLSVAEVDGSAHAIAHASPVFSPRIVPAWSPDSKLVAYSGPTGGVAVVGADGANPHEV